jgi:hypothetical protein
MRLLCRAVSKILPPTLVKEWTNKRYPACSTRKSINDLGGDFQVTLARVDNFDLSAGSVGFFS